MPSLDNSSTNEIVLDESSNENNGTSLNPISALSPPFQEAKEEEARELAKVIRKMHAADKRYWEESEFLLFQNEVALHTLFQDDNKLTVSQCKLDAYFQAEGDAAEGWEAAESPPCTQEMSKADEEEGRIAIVDDSEVDRKGTVEKWRPEAIREHNQTTPQSLDVQLIEDRIDKARLDLSFLEQQTTQMETEMKTLQMELAKLKDQLCKTQIQYDE